MEALTLPATEDAPPLRMLVFTWNVGHAAPTAEQLEAWLPARGEGADLLVVATQENHYYAGTAPKPTRWPAGAATANDTDTGEAPSTDVAPESSADSPTKRQPIDEARVER